MKRILTIVLISCLSLLSLPILASEELDIKKIQGRARIYAYNLKGSIYRSGLFKMQFGKIYRQYGGKVEKQPIEKSVEKQYIDQYKFDVLSIKKYEEMIVKLHNGQLTGEEKIIYEYAERIINPPKPKPKKKQEKKNYLTP